MKRIDKKAIVFGATGAVGKEVLNLLIKDERYEKVVVFSRRYLEVNHEKVEVILDPLNDLDSLRENITGDDLFCCLGTTSRKAGNRENFRKVDLEMPVTLARIASANEVEGFVVISSIGAGKMGRGFYLDTKTEMENEVKKYPFERLSVIRPSLLMAHRDEFRFGEEAGKVLDSLFGWAMVGKMKRYRGIDTHIVARAMVAIMNLQDPKMVYESDELPDLK